MIVGHFGYASFGSVYQLKGPGLSTSGNVDYRVTFDITFILIFVSNKIIEIKTRIFLEILFLFFIFKNYSYYF